jgi:DNA-binding NtrC family response regulator
MVLDDDPNMGPILQRTLMRDRRLNVELASDPGPVMRRLEDGSANWDVALLDVVLNADLTGIDVLHQFGRSSATTSVVMMSGIDKATTATTCLRGGAVDYITKPFSAVQLTEVVFEAARKRAPRPPLSSLIGESAAMQSLRNEVRRIARQSQSSSVLIQGETGTGKELAARELHLSSERGRRTFVPVNCGALTEGLAESELFGHSRGAFTGAITDHLGLFVQADGGTLFLDEVGDMSLALQVKLLRVLQERMVRPVGLATERAVDVRIIAATHVDLGAALATNRIREDFYYRLNVIPLVIPPLRDRLEDVPLLAEHFLRKYGPRDAAPPELHRSTLDILQSCSWPGNVRQLENAIQHAVALRSGNVILPAALPVEMLAGMRPHLIAAMPARLSAPAYDADDEQAEPLPPLQFDIADGTNPGTPPPRPTEVGARRLDADPGRVSAPGSIALRDPAGSKPDERASREALLDEELASLVPDKPEPMTPAKRKAMRRWEYQYLRRMLMFTSGSVTKAAFYAGIDRANFRRLLRRHGIDRLLFSKKLRS